MKKTGIFLLVTGVVFLFSCQNNHLENKKSNGKTVVNAVVSHPLVVMKTKFGEITAELYPEKAPLTVANAILMDRASLPSGGLSKVWM